MSFLKNMVYGSFDLTIFGKDIKTNQGYDVGWALVESILSDHQYLNIPILIYTTRSLVNKDIDLLRMLNEKRLVTINYLEKHSHPEAFLEWLVSLNVQLC
jgi:hypothetical protein